MDLNIIPNSLIDLIIALGQVNYDIVVCEFYVTAIRLQYLIHFFQPQASLVIDSVDVHYLRERSAGVLGLPEGESEPQTKCAELNAYRRADCVIVVTEEEQQALFREARLANTFVIPNIVPLRHRSKRIRQPEVIFIGGFRHAPNIDAVRWLVSTIWPKVRSQVAAARLLIIGSAVPPEIEALADAPGVEVLGYVPDTGPYLDRAAVSVAPLRYGAGMKGKVNEAMAAGVPVVSTSIGMQGLKVQSGRHCIIADTADDLAQSIASLLVDPEAAEAIGHSGQEFIAAICSAERVEQLVLEMLGRLLSSEQISHFHPLSRLRILLFSLPGMTSSLRFAYRVWRKHRSRRSGAGAGRAHI